MQNTTLLLILPCRQVRVSYGNGYYTELLESACEFTFFWGGGEGVVGTFGSTRKTKPENLSKNRHSVLEITGCFRDKLFYCKHTFVQWSSVLAVQAFVFGWQKHRDFVCKPCLMIHIKVQYFEAILYI